VLCRKNLALGQCRAQLYRTRRPYVGLSDLEYPFHDRTVTVTTCGRICIGRRKINLSQVFVGQNVGIKEVADKIWLVSFMHYDLGFSSMYPHGRTLRQTARCTCLPSARIFRLDIRLVVSALSRSHQDAYHDVLWSTPQATSGRGVEARASRINVAHQPSHLHAAGPWRSR
jgi:hypothetical protein